MDEKKSEGKERIFLVPHTHYDAIWVFTKEDYFHINITFILKNVVELLEKTKDYKFMIEQTFLLEEVEREYPELFLKIAKYIKEGRIEIANGEYLMADTMIPSGETLVREILAGKKYVKEKFGVDVPVMWQADSFGLNAQLPQIYKKCGYKHVAFRRGAPIRKPSEFLWEGLDRTRILSHWMPLGYRAGLNLSKLDESYLKLKECAATSCILMPSGSGVTMPQPETGNAVKEWNRKHDVKMKIGTVSEFFSALEKEGRDFQVVKGEMYCGKYSEVFPDCCSSRMWIKQGLSKYEDWVLRCERWSTISFLLSRDYPCDELENCWRRILFNAFHDAAPGTGMDDGYEEVRQHFNVLNTTLLSVFPSVLQSIVEKESEGKDGGDVVVFNSLSWKVRNWCEVELNFDVGKVRDVRGLKSGKEDIEIEVIKFARYEDGSLRSAKIGFVAAVPALGYKVYRILEKKPKAHHDKDFMMRGNTIKNRFFTVETDPSRGVVDIVHGKNSYTANQLVVEEETGDLYYHRQSLDYPVKTEEGDGVKYGSFRVENFYVDKSPLRYVINIRTNYFSLRWPYRMTEKREPLIWRHKFLSFTKKIIIYRDIPRVDFVTHVDNSHPRLRLRVRFSTDIESPDYVCGTQFGAVRRKTELAKCKVKDKWVEDPTGIFPSLRWVDYSDGKRGLSVIHKGIPENEVKDGNVHLTLLRCVSMLSSDGKTGPAVPVPDAQEFKKYVFRYSAYPHRGGWQQASSYKHAHEYNTDLVGFQITDVRLPLMRSFLKIEPDNVVLSALKKAEDKNEVILRFYETSGRRSDVSVTLFMEPKSARAVNLIEKDDKDVKKDVKVKGGVIKLEMKAFEIVTLRLKF